MRDCRIRSCGAVRFLAAAMVLVLSPMLAAAQQEPLTPFASRLRAEPVGYQIKLTWRDSPDVTGTYKVYRAAEEITPQNLDKALLVGKADSGVEFYVDTPPDQKGYFFAVLAQDRVGKLYTLLIPYRNKTGAAVAAQSPAPEENLASRVTGLTATITSAGDAVEVAFSSSSRSRDLLLFRGTVPLLTPEDLLRSVSVTQLDPGTTRYILPALSGVDYWFAVLDAGLYKLGQAPLEKGGNATTAPVQAPVGAGRVSLAPPPAPRRALPLPSLQVTFGVQSGVPLANTDELGIPPEREISGTAAKSLALLLDEVPPTPPRHMKPQVLALDATPMPGGELARLRDIVTGPFLGGDVKGAQKMFLDFLRLPRTAEIEAHARFYLGQTYYIEGRQRDALLQFLLAQDHYYQETKPWEDACFELLIRADR